MAAALESHVQAAQKFLTSVRHLASFKEARTKQVEVLSKKLAAHPVSVEQAAKLVAVLDDGIWEDHLDSLKEAVRLTETGDRKMAALQDYLAMPQYFTAAMWKVLSEEKRSVALEKLCRHLRALGLKNPSEATQGMILCLVYDLEGKLLGTEQWAVTLKEKTNVQKYLKQASHGVQLNTLPHDRSECSPEVMQSVFGNEAPMDCLVPFENLLARAKDWPMRNTHRFAQGKQDHMEPKLPTSADGELMHKMGHLMAGFMQAHAPADVSLPGLKIFTQERKEERKVPMPLPLEDKKEDDVVKPAGEEQREAAAQPAGQGAVAKTLQALMGEFEESPAAESSPKPRSKTKTKKAMKKPAASAAVPILKRPSSRRACAPPVLRRPAASTGSTRGSAQEGETREERRLRLIDIFVPKHLQRKYREGCAKCYYRKGCTLSCWKLRGFQMSD